MKSSYLVISAVLLVMGIAAISIGGWDNITGAFSVDSSRISYGGFSSAPLELKMYTNPSLHPSKKCNLTLFSGTEDIIKETGKHAVETYSGNPGWTAKIPGAKWIWKSYYVENPTKAEAYTFTREFNWTGEIQSATLDIAGDSSYEVKVNNRLVASTISENNYGFLRSYNVKIYLHSGTNTLQIKVRNLAGNSDPKLNPAGLLYKLEIKKSGCITCNTRVECNTIYNFTDNKPGDYGQDIFEFDVSGINAWACVFFKNKSDLENNLTEPEREAGDTTQGKKQGELSEFMNFFAWIDEDRDNEYSPGDTYIFKGNLSGENPKFSIADSVGNYRTPIAAGTQKFIGIYWCFGEITGIDTHSLVCDGSSPKNNVAQTDILKMDITFYVYQSKSNPNFRCSQDRILLI